MDIHKIRAEKIRTLPNELRAYVCNIELMVIAAEDLKENGAITDGQLATFFELIHIAMQKD